jgi:hypothetical protein
VSIRRNDSRFEPLNRSVGAPVCDRLWVFDCAKAGCKPALRFMGRAVQTIILASVHTRATESHHAETRRETAEEKARRILREELDKLGWTEPELAQRAKGDMRKIRIARRLRSETAVTLKWIAAELNMGIWMHVANRLQNAKGNGDAGNQDQVNLV